MSAVFVILLQHTDIQVMCIAGSERASGSDGWRDKA